MTSPSIRYAFHQPIWSISSWLTRETAATLLLSQGVPARDGQDVPGHSQVTLTLGTYSHVMPAMLQTSADALEWALG